MTDGGWLSEPFGDLFGGLDRDRRRDATWVLWHMDGFPDVSYRVFDADLERFLSEIEAGVPGIFMVLFD